ncbi:MAG: hypothetical protein QOD55_1999 [Solirubrobacteraceae bacterium]|jgi:hypothetical protein|nr:hypothetical protein [Solirubrobacteraceae bacterium]
MKILVHTFSRPLLRAAAALALGLSASAIAPAQAPADADATAQTAPATAVTATTALLNGVIGPASGTTYYTFEYGTTTNYGKITPIAAVPGFNGARAVSAPLGGLTPATVYHFRLITGNGRTWRVGVGADQTFTTTPAPAPLPVAPVPVPAAPAAAAAPAPTPTLGKTVVVAPLGGTVKVKVPGAAEYTVLGAGGGAVPTGATVDTRAGEVQLTTALPGGKTQAAQFHGGVFRVRQSAAGGGTTDIDLRGPALQCSRGTARASAAAAAKRKPPKRKLWGQDKGGRYRTHGANSVATVRGTKWVTTDTCSGTRTTVTEGAVSVRDLRRKRSVLVRAGHSYVARPR